MDDNFYEKFDNNSNKAKSSASNNIIAPFISGVLGATLVIGTCFGVPKIRNKLLVTNNSEISSSSVITQVSSNATEISFLQPKTASSKEMRRS